MDVLNKCVDAHKYERQEQVVEPPLVRERASSTYLGPDVKDRLDARPKHCTKARVLRPPDMRGSEGLGSLVHELLPLKTCKCHPGVEPHAVALEAVKAALVLAVDQRCVSGDGWWMLPWQQSCQWRLLGCCSRLAGRTLALPSGWGGKS